MSWSITERKMLRKQSLLNIDYFSQRLKMTIFVAMKKTANKQEGISVECQPPACRQYALHSEQVATA